MSNNDLPKVSKSKFVVGKHHPSMQKNRENSGAGGSGTALTARRQHSIDTVASKLSMMTTKELPALSTVSTKGSQDPMTFLEFRGYHVVKELGAGGFAQPRQKASRAMAIGQSVAIKVFDLTDESKQGWIINCLKREMLIAKNLQHKNIVTTYEVFKTQRNGFIVMKLADGGDLSAKMIKQNEPYSEDETRKYFRQLMEGLAYMHSQNTAHRDLKLENFLLFLEDDRPVISDFGFAVCATQTHTVLTEMMRNSFCGTPGYMAPEVSAGRPYDSKAVDVYAMGVSLFEMLNGKKPAAQGDLRYRVQLPASCRALIESMLMSRASRRPKAAQVLEDKWLTPNVANRIGNMLGFT
ncbi:MAP/microtubule affinity-regulating kinase 4 [Tyrophagus putrescentiae]|nr:MAP/microtubule affinity-regulating kinase 4 [Tyrophagus putrescentiae]